MTDEADMSASHRRDAEQFRKSLGAEIIGSETASVVEKALVDGVRRAEAI